ncbi:hypothetical protein F4809DRAFT_102346 [Biscogniauxia mediterranea]|nr:hypothetical protein F4809DRAFT_102346 [Biscogniauxia mediterranea]
MSLYTRAMSKTSKTKWICTQTRRQPKSGAFISSLAASQVVEALPRSYLRSMLQVQYREKRGLHIFRCKTRYLDDIRRRLALPKTCISWETRGAEAGRFAIPNQTPRGTPKLKWPLLGVRERCFPTMTSVKPMSLLIRIFVLPLRVRAMFAGQIANVISKGRGGLRSDTTRASGQSRLNR